MILTFLKRCKKILPIDFNQYELRDKSKAKTLAFSFAELKKNKGLALDIGCREGFWSKKLMGLGYTVTSTDIECIYEKCLHIDADKPLPFPSGIFDIVWGTEVFEHLKNPKLSSGEMRRVLANDGMILLTTPNSYFWFFKIVTLFGHSLSEIQNPDHKQFFRYADIRTLFPSAEIYGYFPYTLLKVTIKNRLLISWLSPTFIIVEKNDPLRTL